eukprot:366464-Chlamydomonas_euryale.AAC.5
MPDVHACQACSICMGGLERLYVKLRPRAGRGRGRRDRRLRSEAEPNMFCARMSQPRFHKE